MKVQSQILAHTYPRTVFARLIVVGLIGALSLSTMALAKTNQVSSRFISAVTVKLSSGRCGLNEKLFQGSGVFLRKGTSVYVLTSNHVVLNSNDGYCHQARSENGREWPLSLVASDFAHGLSLLKVKSGSIEAGLDYDSFKNWKRPQQGTKLVMAGFPLALDRLIQHQNGSVLNASSPRHLFSATMNMIETINAHGEYGMSGGPAFDAESYALIGLLSHQVLTLVPGGETEARIWSELDQKVVQNKVLLIPIDEIQSWLSQVFKAETQYRPQLLETAEDRALAVPRVYADGFEFIRVGDEELNSQIGGKKGGGDGTGIGGKKGGGDGTGIGGKKGGGDGTGIGGDGSTSEAPAAVHILIKISSDPRSHQASYLRSPEGQNRAKWFSDVSSWLKQNGSIYVSEFVRKRENGSGFDRYTLSSIEQFFRFLSDPTLRPVTRIVGVTQENSGYRNALVEKLSVAMSTVDRTWKVEHEANVPSTELLMLTGLNQQLVTLLALLEAGDPGLLSTHDIATVSEDGAYSSAWKTFFTYQFKAALDILTSLKLLENEIKSPQRR